MISDPAGIKPVGDRQQKRHGQRGADAGQHAHGGAKGHADQRVKQDHRIKRAVDRPCKQKARTWSSQPPKIRVSGKPARKVQIAKAGQRRRRPAKAKSDADGQVRAKLRLPKAAAVQANRRPEAMEKPRRFQQDQLQLARPPMMNRTGRICWRGSATPPCGAGPRRHVPAPTGPATPRR